MATPYTASWATGVHGRAGAAAEARQVPAIYWCRIVEYDDAYAMQFGAETTGAPTNADLAELAARLAALKGAVPQQRRHWDALTKTWWIDPVVELLVRSLSRWAERWFEPGQLKQSRTAGPAPAHWATLEDTGEAATEAWVSVVKQPAPDPAMAPEAAPGARAPGAPGTAAGGASGANGVNGTRAQAPARPVKDPVAEAYNTLWLRPGAPPSVIKAVYRALATLHHPDRGGEMETMQRINAAYAVLEKLQA